MMGGSPGGGIPQDFDPASLWGGWDDPGMAGGNMSLPPGVEMSTPTPGAPTSAPPGLMPWDYQVPNPSVPKPPPQHVDFEDFPGGRGRGGRRGRRGGRKARKRNRYFDQLGGGQRPNKFWDR